MRKSDNINTMEFRKERMASLIKDIASSFLKLKGGSGVLISATRVGISRDFKNVTVFVSVFPEDKESDVINALKNKNWELKNYTKKQLKMKFLPQFKFEIDKEEKARQRMEKILNEEE